MEIYTKIIKKVSKEEEYVVKNLIWSGVHLMITLSTYLIHKVLKAVPLTATRPDVYVATMTTFISNNYDDL